MAKRAKPEEIIAKLREVEVRLSQGESVGMAAKSISSCKSADMDASGCPDIAKQRRPPSFVAMKGSSVSQTVSPRASSTSPHRRHVTTTNPIGMSMLAGSGVDRSGADAWG